MKQASQQSNQFSPDLFTLVDVDIANDAGGWAMLSPYGDFPNTGTVFDKYGKPQTIVGVQRVRKPDAEALQAEFSNLWNRLKARFSVGVPIYLGHPDHPDPAVARDYPDKSEKGVIGEVEARDNGLFCRPVFNNDGAALLSQKKLCLSVRWGTDLIGEEGDKLVFRPVKIKSAGLVARSALPVEYLNAARPEGDTLKRELQTEAHNQEDTMNREKLLALLKKLGCEVANDAPEAAIDAALAKATEAVAEFANNAKALDTANKKVIDLTDKLDKAKAEFSNTQSARKTAETDTANKIANLETEFANERKARIDERLADALAHGKIAAHERDQWGKRLAGDFANESAALAKLQPNLKTKSLVLDLGARKIEISNVGDRRKFIEEAISQRAAERKLDRVKDYDTLFNSVLKDYPQLLNMMSEK